MIQHSTKDKILLAARELFSTHGFAGTSIGKIAKLAGVNHSLIFHHFQNKQQLWLAVKASIVQEANTKESTLPSLELRFEDFLQQLFMQTSKFYQSNPDIIRMLNWQRLEHDANQAIGVTKSTEMQAWIMAFKHYQRCGDINSELKPEFIITMVLAIISSAALDPNIFIKDETERKRYFTFCVRCLLKALQ